MCANCSKPSPSTRLRRIALLGLRALCDTCVNALTPLYGYSLERDPVLRRGTTVALAPAAASPLPAADISAPTGGAHT